MTDPPRHRAANENNEWCLDTGVSYRYHITRWTVAVIMTER